MKEKRGKKEKKRKKGFNIYLLVFYSKVKFEMNENKNKERFAKSQ